MSFIDDVIAERLRKLKGEAQRRINENESRQHFRVPSRTQVEQVEDLLQEINSQASLESHSIEVSHSLDEEIRARLNKLKAEGNNHDTEQKTDDDGIRARRSQTMEEIVARFKSMAELENRLEASLPIAPSMNPLAPSPGDEPDDELPWCTICNEDATVRCRACDNDLYCDTCFAEFHSADDCKSHSKEPYEEPM